MVTRSVIEPERWPVPVGRRSIINGRRRHIPRRHARRNNRAVTGRWLVHVEINAGGNPILRSHHVAGLKSSDLGELVRGDWQSADHVLIRSDVVEGAVRIAKNLDMARG